MFPNNSELQKENPLESKVFGHRFRQDQTIYEYLLEFLVVLTSKKNIAPEDSNDYVEEYFPNIEEASLKKIKYIPTNNVGLKRFIFFLNSKQEGRFGIDEKAFDELNEFIKGKLDITMSDDMINKEFIVKMMQNLLYGFSAVTENRSWFAQSMLPICPSVITTEIMGKTSARKNKTYPDNEFRNRVDRDFETSKYSFMARGGEIYYLHVLRALSHYPAYKEKIELGLHNLINQFPEMEKMCNDIQQTWLLEGLGVTGYADDEETANRVPPVVKTLGTIPDGFCSREENTLMELCNILSSDMHPFEKLDILSYGIILQLIIMTYDQARYASGKEQGSILIDINCYKNDSNDEIKKAAHNNYNEYSQDIVDALFENLEGNVKEKSTEEKTISDAIDNSIKVYKKIGKRVGILKPDNEKYLRFTINEKMLKYLVLSLIKPGTKMTLDRFIEKIYEQYRLVIGPDEYIASINTRKFKVDETYLEKNKKDFQTMLKESGFLRELSDSTSIVTNPYREVKYEDIF